jgi:hypothetical protein
MMSIVFKITQNAFREFTLAEVLLMAAINQLEAKRKADGDEEPERTISGRKRLRSPSLRAQQEQSSMRSQR